MSWIFRKVFSIGLLRFTLSNRGLGASVGAKGIRTGITATGRRYLSLALRGTGLRFLKWFRR